MASRVLTSRHLRGIGALAVVTLVAIGVSSCGDDGDGRRCRCDDDSVVVSDAWARSSPAGVADGVAYMTIESPVDDQLVGVSVPADVAAAVELHETVVGDATGAAGTEHTT